MIKKSLLATLAIGAASIGCETTGGSFYVPTPPQDPIKNVKILKTITVSDPFVFRKGEFLGPPDSAGGIYHYVAHPRLGDGGQDERQKAFLLFKDGSSARNIAVTGAKAIEVWGNVKMKNIHGNPLNIQHPWERMIKLHRDSSLVIDGISARRWEDKVVNQYGNTSLEIVNGFFVNGKRVVSDFWLRHGPTDTHNGEIVKTEPNKVIMRNVVARKVSRIVKANQAGDSGVLERIWTDSRVLETTNGADPKEFKRGPIWRLK